MAHIRKAHNAWGKARREFSGVAMQSFQHPNTKGCKFEADLATDITKGNKSSGAGAAGQETLLGMGSQRVMERSEIGTSKDITFGSAQAGVGSAEQTLLGNGIEVLLDDSLFQQNDMFERQISPEIEKDRVYRDAVDKIWKQFDKDENGELSKEETR